MAVVLPRPVGFQDPAVEQWAQRMTDAVQRALDDLALPPKVGVAVTGVVPQTAFNPSTAGLVSVAQTLATLMQALKLTGRIT